MENLFNTSDKVRNTKRRIPVSEPATERSNLVATYHLRPGECQQLTDLNSRFTIIWLKSGKLSVLDQGQLRVIHHDRLFCMLPGHHLHLLPDDDTEAYVVSFSEDFLLMAEGQDMYPFSMHYTHRNGPGLVMGAGHEGQKSGVESLLKLVVRNDGMNCHFGIEIFKGLLQIMAVYFSRGGQVEPHPEQLAGYDEQLFRKFTELLDADYVTRKSVMEYARALAVTPNYLSDAVKRVSGHTASFHIQQRIIMEAKRAAANCHVSMKEVAYRVGFMDIAHFSKFFRTHTGMNFTDYKKLLI
jgi:AraC family transcriptional activator of pobA